MSASVEPSPSSERANWGNASYNIRRKIVIAKFAVRLRSKCCGVFVGGILFSCEYPSQEKHRCGHTSLPVCPLRDLSRRNQSLPRAQFQWFGTSHALGFGTLHKPPDRLTEGLLAHSMTEASGVRSWSTSKLSEMISMSPKPRSTTEWREFTLMG